VTFLELSKRMARRTGKNSASLDSLTQQRFLDFLNEAHAAVLRHPGREALRYMTVPFQSVVGQPLYALPTDATRINRILDRVNDRRLEYHTPDWLDTVDPDPVTVQGTPRAWVRRGYAYVQKQPTVSSVLWAKSFYAGDTTQTVTVEGLVSDGRYFKQTATLAGLTAVQVGQYPFATVSRFFLSAPPNGNAPVTLYQDAALLLPLASIDPPRTQVQYQIFQLYPTPSSAQDYYMDLLMRVPEVVSPVEEPILPLDFHEILIPMALLREMSKADDPERFAQYRLEAEQGLRELDTFLTAHPDLDVKWGGPEQQYSHLGPWFPSGS